MRHSFEVIVVGGGMVGSTLAIALAQAGMQVALLEQSAPEPFALDSAPDLRVSALNPASQAILQQLGVWASVTSMRHCPFQQMAVWESLQLPMSDQPLHQRFNRTVFDASQIGRSALGEIVENRLVQLALWKLLKQQDHLELICPAEIEQLSWDQTGQAEVILADGQTLTAPLVVGADGAQSQVREAAKFEIDCDDYPQHALVATVAIGGGQQVRTWQAFTSTGPQALLPLADSAGQSWASLVWYHQPEEVARLMALSDAAFLTELQATFPPELPDIVQLHQRGSFPLVRRHAKQYVAPGVALVGDAAHTIHPLAGQGVNLGFQDAAWLAQTVVEGWRSGEAWGSRSVLQRYQRQRLPENRKMQRLMDLFCHSFSNDRFALKLLRNIGLGLAGQLTVAHKPVLKYALGLAGRQPRLAQGRPL